MRLVGFELAKLVRTTPMVWFLAGCLGFNLLLTWTGPDADYPRYVASVAGQLGVNVDESFPGRVAALSGVEESWSNQRLVADATAVAGVVGGIDPVALGEAYRRALNAEGPVAALLTAKYALADPIAARRAASAGSPGLYFAGATPAQHQFWFGTLAGALTVQGLLLAAVAGLHAAGVEYANRTLPLLASSRTGRQVLRPKLVATLAAAVGGYLLLSVASLAVACLRVPLPAVWASTVSGPFNVVDDVVVGQREFFTWLNLSVAGYLGLQLVISAGLVAAVALVATAVGTVVRNHYLGFGLLVILAGVLLVAPMQLGTSLTGLLLTLNPIWLWLKQPSWFSDGGFDIIMPAFETVGAASSLALATTATVLAFRSFRKADL